MRSRILFTAAAAAALSIGACNRPEGGSEKATNETEETKNGSSGSEAGETRNDSAPADDSGNREGQERNNEGEDSGSRRDDDSASSGSRGGDQGELRDALQQAAREQRARLPLRDGITTVYDVEAEGTEFIVSLRISQDFSDEQFERLEQAFQRNSCNGDSAELIRMGATTTYRVTDAEGERRSFSFDSC